MAHYIQNSALITFLALLMALKELPLVLEKRIISWLICRWHLVVRSWITNLTYLFNSPAAISIATTKERHVAWTEKHSIPLSSRPNSSCNLTEPSGIIFSWVPVMKKIYMYWLCYTPKWPKNWDFFASYCKVLRETNSTKPSVWREIGVLWAKIT